MVRLYKTHARQLLLLLKSLKKAKPEISFDDFVEEFLAGDDKELKQTAALARSNSKSSTTVDDIIESLEKQIQVGNKFEGDLIDTVVSMLSVALPANGPISPQTIENLRVAIMRPDELAVLKKQLEEIAYKCSSCGRGFGVGEPGLIYTKSSGVYLMCMACKPPQRFCCVKCHNPFSAGTTQTHRFNNAMTCSACKTAKGKDTPAGTGQEIPVMGPELVGQRIPASAAERFFETVSREQVRRVAYPIDVPSDNTVLGRGR